MCHQRGHVASSARSVALRAQHHRFPCSWICSLRQWPMRSTAMARQHKAGAWRWPAARSCAAASRCAWWQRHITDLPDSMLCSPSQWARRITAMPKQPPATSCIGSPCRLKGPAGPLAPSCRSQSSSISAERRVNRQDRSAPEKN